MKKIVTYGVLLLLIGAVLFLYSFSSRRNGQKKVKDIEVQFEKGANQFLTHELVNKLLIQKDEYVKNLSKSSVDLQRIETVVEDNPYVEKAKVFLTPADVLHVQIKQRQPLARIILGDASCYVDKFGSLLPLSTYFSARVPLVQGIKTEEDVQGLLLLMTAINNDDFLKKEVIGIVKNDRGAYSLKVRSGDYTVDFGKLNDINLKFRKLKAFYNKALADGTINNYKKITLKYHNQVVCTKQDKDG